MHIFERLGKLEKTDLPYDLLMVLHTVDGNLCYLLEERDRLQDKVSQLESRIDYLEDKINAQD